MKPFDREYVLDKIREYNNKIKNNKIGDFEIKSIDGLKGTIQGYLYSKEDELNVRILELHAPEHVWMRLTPLEIQASYFAIKMAKGKVGVVGLGLGYAVEEMAKKLVSDRDHVGSFVEIREKEALEIYKLAL